MKQPERNSEEEEDYLVESSDSNKDSDAEARRKGKKKKVPQLSRPPAKSNECNRIAILSESAKQCQIIVNLIKRQPAA